MDKDEFYNKLNKGEEDNKNDYYNNPSQYYQPQQPQQQTNEQNYYQSQQQPNNNNYYYTSPVNNNQGQSRFEGKAKAKTVVNGTVVDNGKKKKKKGALAVIIIILVLCAAVAAFGIVYANIIYERNTSSQSETIEDGNDKNSDNNSNTNDDSASASVVGSNEASKTDEYGNLTAAGVAKKAMDSCVGITVYTKQNSFNYFYSYGQDTSEGEEQKSGEGSGVIMSEANGKTYILTAAHVIADSSSSKVTLNNGKEYDATIVGYDSQTDIGVLSINKTGLQIAEFGDSKDIEVGATCVAIGCPAGLQFMNSVTQGIVSALDRPVSSSIGYTQTCIQVDAAINPGNSGGALFNMQGQVIGINSSKIASTEYEGMGFAVPSNTAVETANSLIKVGYVEGRAKLGIQYISLQNYNNASAILSALEQKGYKDANGTMVIQETTDNSDLEGKVEQYDMIVAVDGEVLTSTDIMTSYLSNHKPNDVCTLTIARVTNNSIKISEVKCKLIESKE